MHWATRADCQIYFETCFLGFFSKSNFGANCAHTALSDPLEWDSITGLAAALSESMTHSSLLLQPRGEASWCIQWYMSSFYCERSEYKTSAWLCHDLNRVTNLSTRRRNTFAQQEILNVCSLIVISHCTDNSTSEATVLNVSVLMSFSLMKL